MSIIDQARAVAERRWTPSRHLEWNNLEYHDEGLASGFLQGAQWLLDQLADPDQATVDAVARQLNHDGWTCISGEHEPDHFQDCADCRVLCRAMARAAITALANHLNGPGHE